MIRVRSRLQRAYTLIELMTVMAITAILLTIIIYPVFQVFGFTRQAQSFSDAQFHAKTIADRIGAEIGNNAGVRDTSANHSQFQIDVKNSGGTSFAPVTQATLSSLVVPVPGQADTLMTGWSAGWAGSKATPATLSNAMLDIWKAAQDGSVGASGGYINPSTGKEDPTLTEPKGQALLPVAPGRTLIRYAVTLRDPFSPYNNMYDGILMKPLGGRDNLYVLRRFEVPTYVQVTDAGKSYPVVNKLAFVDLGRLSSAHKARLKVGAGIGPLYDDPFFMDPIHSLEGLSGAGVLEWDASNPSVTYDVAASATHDKSADPTKAEMITYWLRHSTVVTELSRFDMISAEYDRRTKAVVYDGNTPRVFPLVQFKPSRVSSEPAVGQLAVRNGQEVDNAGMIGSETFRTEKGMWSNPVVRLYPQTWSPNASGSADDTHRYTIARPDATGSRDSLSLYSYNPQVDGTPEATSGIEVFDLGVYNQRGNAYPFSAALSAANARSGWTSSSLASNVLNSFEGFSVFNAQGFVRASFDISEVGNAGATPTVAGNLPNSVVTNTYSPTSDPDALNATTHPYTGAGYDINGCFNRVWAGDTYLPGASTLTSVFRPDIHRFLDLRVTPQSDGTTGPLDPTSGFAHANIVPGSEEIWGPDQNPGPNYGTQVRYYRVTRNPGPNQYRINYTDQTAPDLTVFGYGSQVLDNTTDPKGFGRYVLMPRYKRGYVQFDSDPNTPLPAGTITVKYRFQFTMPGDVVAVDYDTREVMSVLITVKSFPQSSLSQAQMVTVPATAKVRYVLK